VILMNTAPVSSDGYHAFQRELERRRTADENTRLEEIRTSAGFQQSALDADAEYHRIHFRAGLPHPKLLEQVVGRLRRHTTPAGVRKAEMIEPALRRNLAVGDVRPTAKAAGTDRSHARPTRIGRLRSGGRRSPDRTGDTGSTAEGHIGVRALRLPRGTRRAPYECHRTHSYKTHTRR
jgi:hypothetical protein